MAHTAIATQVSNPDATPSVKNNSFVSGGVVRSYIGTLAAATFVAGTAAQTYAMVRVPARARLIGLKAYNAAMTSGSVKIGVFRPDDGIAISDACFATAVDLNVARWGTDVGGVAPPQSSTSVGTPDAALSSVLATAVGTAGATGDVDYDIVAKIVTIVGAAKDFTLEALYVLPE